MWYMTKAVSAKTSTPVLAGVYARISKDDAGDMLGVRRQERDARASVRAQGLDRGRGVRRDDVSAWNGRSAPPMSGC